MMSGRRYLAWAATVSIGVALALCVMGATQGAGEAPTGKYDFGSIITERGLIWGILIAFGAGVLVSFTPCVYPMIPITIGIIGGQKEETSVGRSLFLSCTYVLGLAIVYSVLGLIVAAVGGEIRGFLMGPYVLIGVAVIFAALGLGMLGLYELRVPSSLANKLQSVGGTGVIGVLLMGMVSGLVASPCTAAPLAGILTFVAVQGDPVIGFVLLFTFAWGMGLLLIVVGTSAGALKTLPTSGTWMIDVQHLFGFLLIGVAIYFVRTLIPELAYHIGIAACMIAGGIAFGALDSLPQDPGAGLRLKKGIALVIAALGLYVLIGTLWTKGALLPEGSRVPTMVARTPGDAGDTQVSTPAEIAWETDIDAAFARAAEEGKWVLIDFTAEWCEYCKKLEREVFPRPDIVEAASRYVPLQIDATDLNEEEAELDERYGVLGSYPALVVADEDRHLMALLPGYYPAEDVLAFLRSSDEDGDPGGSPPPGET